MNLEPRSGKPPEINWFAALCDDDYEYLGQSDPLLLSSWAHCRNIVLQAEQGGFDGVLLPSGYQLGLDATIFAAAIAPLLRRLRLLWAVRCGEDWPVQLARRIATLDQLLEGHLMVNIISSELPGEKLSGPARYRRSAEVMQILKTLLAGKHLHHQGEFYTLDIDPPRIATTKRTCPLLYFGGLSEEARQTAAAHCDVYLMWPDTMAQVQETIADLKARAERLGRRLRFGYRVHVIVRDTEQEARASAARLVSRLDDKTGSTIRNRSLDAKSSGVARQAELREVADSEGYIEEHLWSGIGRARSGCGAAIVGNPDQVLAKLHAYQEAGIEAFILSGYPHQTECDLFARHVLPRLVHQPLAG